MVAILSNLIRELRLEFLVRKHFPAPCFYEINNGLCEDFALEVIKQARTAGLSGDFTDLCNEDLMCGLNGEVDESDVWDWPMLAEHWKASPPAGLTADDMNALHFGSHVWVAHEGRHYDAECPDGVESPFDLPIFRRTIVGALNKRGIVTPEVITDDLAVTLAGKQVRHQTYIGKAVDFLRDIGIPVEWKVGASGFLPFLEIEAGGMLIDPRCPVSNVLHEAGHLACVPAEYRPQINQNVDGGVRQMLDHMRQLNLPPDHPLSRAAVQCSDPEATAWAWAAGLHLGIPPKLIILDSEYDGVGEDIRQMLEARAYLGINGLQHAGFTAARQQYTWLNLPTYPEMAFWLQGGPAPIPEEAASLDHSP